jgi:hypothetical protein
MTDLLEQLRRAVGEPPPDRDARERALVRLRAHVSEARQVRVTTAPVRSARVRIGVAALALSLLVIGASGLAGLRRPAAAVELDRLAQVNRDWLLTRDVPQVQIEQMYLASYTSLDGGPSFTMVVHSHLSRTVNDDGSIDQTERIISARFEDPDDRAAWKSAGSPDWVTHAGDVHTDHFKRPIYNIAAVSTDPATLTQALEDGSVTSYEPDEGQLFETIASLLAEPELSPDQRVALYQVVGSLDGVELLGDTTDPIDRVGVGFSMMVGSHEQILIFDRNTGQPLATQQFYAPDPALGWEWRAFEPAS